MSSNPGRAQASSTALRFSRNAKPHPTNFAANGTSSACRRERTLNRPPDEHHLRTLTEQGICNQLFLARRLLASGESWAETWLEKFQSEMK